MSSSPEPAAAPKALDGKWEEESKIVIGIDIGSTQSGVAFTFLVQDGDRKLHRVTHWPGQEAESQQSKIPTLIWYSHEGKAVSFGAEAASRQAEEEAEDNGWFLAKNFKLHLHPDKLKNKYGLKPGPLPPGVSLSQIYKDFLGYLFGHTQTYFEDRIVDGKLIWKNYRSQMEIVIAHPNGWGLNEQAFLRGVAVEAGLVPESLSSRVIFVTEAEASVHFCMHDPDFRKSLQVGAKFAVCDAGGSTVDTTVYSVISTRPKLELQEAQASECIQAGGIIVDEKAMAFFEKMLGKAKSKAKLSDKDVIDYTAQAVKDFELHAKRSFKNSKEPASVELGNIRFTCSDAGVRRGAMSISADVVRSFFEGCVSDIIASVNQQVRATPVSHLLLVGGFGDSPYLKNRFEAQYKRQGYKLTLANDPTSKVVANGAVLWRIEKAVTGRVLHESFGTGVTRIFRPFESGVKGRKVMLSPWGIRMVDGGWSQISAKGTVIDEGTVVRETYGRIFPTPHPDLEDFKIDLYSYSRDGNPNWLKTKDGILEAGFQSACTLTANLSNLSGGLEPCIGIIGIFWELSFDICMRFGGTEPEAWMEWEEDGITRTGNVKIVPQKNLLEGI